MRAIWKENSQKENELHEDPVQLTMPFNYGKICRTYMLNTIFTTIIHDFWDVFGSVLIKHNVKFSYISNKSFSALDVKTWWK